MLCDAGTVELLRENMEEHFIFSQATDYQSSQSRSQLETNCSRGAITHIIEIKSRDSK